MKFKLPLIMVILGISLLIISCDSVPDRGDPDIAKLERQVTFWIQMMGTETNSKQIMKYQLSLITVDPPEIAYPKLYEGLKHLKPRVRGGCAYVLGQMGNKEAIPHLVPLLDDSEDMVRMEAAASLVDLKEKIGLYYMINALDHRSQNFRLRANEVLEKATGEDFRFEADGLPEDRRDSRNQWINWWNRNKDSFEIPEKPIQKKLELKAIPLD